MTKYNINRKYSLPQQYEMLDIGVVEDERNPKEILKELDSIHEEYIKQPPPIVEQVGDNPSHLKANPKPVKVEGVPF